jgi:hypothetical protein
MLIDAVVHSSKNYGQIAEYLRMNNMVEAKRLDDGVHSLTVSPLQSRVSRNPRISGSALLPVFQIK